MHIILFLLNPILGFLKSMKNLNAKWALFVFILFYGLYGYATSFELTSADSYRIGARFCQQNYSWWHVWEMYENGALTDVYLVFVFSILKIFTSNPKILMGVFGLVMGTFAGLSIQQLYTAWNRKRTKYFYLLVFLYFLMLSFFNLQTVRFFTATSIFSYFIIQYLCFGRRMALVGALVTPLFHFGYFAAVTALLVYIVFVKPFNSTRLCYLIMASAFVLQFSMPQSIVDDIMGSEEEAETFSSSAAINRKYKTYSKSTDKVPEREVYKEVSAYRQANRLFTKTFSMVSRIGMFLLITVLFGKRKSIIQSDTQRRFFNYVLYAYAVGYAASMLFSNGGRFVLLANLLFVFWFLSVFQNNYNYRMKWCCIWLIPIFFYNISYFFFNVTRIVTPLFWVTPSPITLLDGIGFGPIDFVWY